jgi:hypothetical protein
MIAAQPVPASSQRCFVFVIAIASVMVSAGVISSLGTTNRVPVPAAPLSPPVVVPAPTVVPEPPPPPPPPGTTGVEECDLYLRTLDRFARCDKFPPGTSESIQSAIAESRDAFRQSIETMPPDQRGMLRDTCQQGITVLRQESERQGCPIHD